MAKVEGTQSIPSTLADKYSALLTPKISGNQIRMRCPFDRPLSQAGGPDESEKQKEQRSRFRTAISYFATTPAGQRTRWYESAPIWHSFLWYYNWFMLSALMGVTGIPGGSTAVIKSIQHVLISMPSGSGTGSASIASIDPSRAVVMMNGGSFIAVTGSMGDYPYGFAISIYPYLAEIAATSLKLAWSIAGYGATPPDAAVVSADVIEYI